MEIPFFASKMENMNEKEKSINAPELGGSDSTSPPARGTWDILSDLVQEIILKMVNERKTLLTCRLVNTAWKEVAEETLEKQSISQWTKWKPFDSSDPYLRLPKMELIPDWSVINMPRMMWNHSSLPTIVNPKLGSPFPTNSIEMQMDNIEGDYSKWPPIYKKRKRLQMTRELFTSYGHVINGILSDMKNLKALNLTWVDLGKENESEDEDEEEKVFPLRNLPSLPNLSHLQIIYCNGKINSLLINSYSGQITTLHTTEYIGTCPQPFTNLKQLKLESLKVDDPSLLLPPLEQSPFPSLQYFSVIHRMGSFKWEDVIQVMDSLPPNKLIDLHLDFVVDLNNEMNIQKLNKNMSTFPSIRKLGIHFPRKKIETERIGMWVLPRFPNVNALDLIHYPCQYDCRDDEMPRLEDDKTIDNVVATVAAGFWSKCSELEKISVYRDENNVLRDLRRDIKM